MTDWLVVLLIAFGSALSLIAAIGTLRMPDLYMRIHAATKCSTLGVASLVLAVAIHLNEIGTAARAALVIAFLFLTAPVAAHIIGRAAYSMGVPLWKESVLDELQSRKGGSTRDGRSDVRVLESVKDPRNAIGPGTRSASVARKARSPGGRGVVR